LTKFAWAVTVIFENKNSEIAKHFAKWALSQTNNNDEEWFGNKDFQRVLTKKDGAV